LIFSPLELGRKFKLEKEIRKFDILKNFYKKLGPEKRGLNKT